MIRDFNLLRTSSVESLENGSYPSVSIDLHLVYTGNRGFFTEGQEELRNKINEFTLQTIQSNGEPLAEYHIALEDKLRDEIKKLEKQVADLVMELEKQNLEICEIRTENARRGIFRSRKIERIVELFEGYVNVRRYGE